MELFFDPQGTLPRQSIFVGLIGWTENAGPENGGSKKMKYLKMQDLEMREYRNMTGNWRTSCRKRLHNVTSG